MRKIVCIVMLHVVTVFNPLVAHSTSADKSHSKITNPDLSELLKSVLDDDEDPTIKDIYLGEKKIIGTTAVIDFSSFDVSTTGLVTAAAGINLSGGTAGGANTIDLGSGSNDDITATDVIDLTDGGTSALHTHGAATEALDDLYNNDSVGDAQLQVDAGDVSFDIANTLYKVSIDNTTTGLVTTALEITTSGVGGTFVNAIDTTSASITNAINVGANDITGTGYSITNASGDITLDPTGDVVVTGETWSITAAGTLTNLTTATIDNGSASAPAYSFTNDTDTGFINVAGGDDMDFVAGGIVVVRTLDAGGTGSDSFTLVSSLGGTATTNGICHVVTGTGTDEQLHDCTGTPATLGEWYETEIEIEPGDLVEASKDSIKYQEVKLTSNNAVINGDRVVRTSILKKSNRPYQENLLGVIATASFQVMGEDITWAEDAKHYLPLALMGRTVVKVTTENGPIAIGDPITSSSMAGVGMKATQAGPTVGIALEPYEGSGIGKIMMNVMNKDSFIPDKTSKFIENLSQPGNSSIIEDIFKADESMAFFQKESELKTLNSLVDHYKNSDQKIEIENIISIPASLFDQISTLSQKLDEENVNEDLIVRGDIIQHPDPRVDDPSEEALSYAEAGVLPMVVTRGEARLKDGSTTVELDSFFLEAIIAETLRVRLTAASLDIQSPLIVVKKTETSFTVQQANGKSSQALFMWEASAQQNGKIHEVMPELSNYEKTYVEK